MPFAYGTSVAKEKRIVYGARMRISENAEESQMDRFQDGLRQVLSVSKTDLNRILTAEKSAKAGKIKPGPKPKSSVSVPASRERD
jgi:hypothetical protein